jgi:uncharacterized protein (TIGR02246 family)
MTDDEKAIRHVVETWMSASQSGDIETVLSLMTDDVVFSVCGQAPFGKEAFAKSSKGMNGMKMEGSYEIAELQVNGDWAFLRNHISMRITPPSGQIMERDGYTLTLLRKENGAWKMARDANLMPPPKG